MTHSEDLLWFERWLQLALLGEAQDRHYAVPSAGALYPYEVELKLYTATGTEMRYVATLADLSKILPGLSPPGVCRLSLILWFWPARTMRKYGERGLIYGMQDCGHAIANLTLVARRMGLFCKETPAELTTAFNKPGNPPERVAITRFEINTLEGPPAWGDTARLNGPVLDAMARRRSADTFAWAVSTPDALRDTLTTALGLLEECALSTSPFAFHLAWRDQLGSWHLTKAGTLASLLTDPAKPTDFNPVPMFCNQEFTAGAGAVLMISAPLGPQGEALHQSLMLGQLGQCLYIAAEIHQRAVCCVGGFEYTAAHQFLSLPDDQYAGYAMLFGGQSHAQTKLDRNDLPTPRSVVVAFRSDVQGGTDAQS